MVVCPIGKRDNKKLRIASFFYCTGTKEKEKRQLWAHGLIKFTLLKKLRDQLLFFPLYWLFFKKIKRKWVKMRTHNRLHYRHVLRRKCLRGVRRKKLTSLKHDSSSVDSTDLRQMWKWTVKGRWVAGQEEKTTLNEASGEFGVDAWESHNLLLGSRSNHSSNGRGRVQKLP